MINVLIVEDHLILSEGIEALLNTEETLNVTNRVCNGEDAIKHCTNHEVHLVIMDLSLPGINGIETTKKLLKNSPQLKIIVLTMHSQKSMINNALEAGAQGYLLKDSAYEELIEAVYTVMKNKTYLSKILKSDNHSIDKLFSLLSEREREVARYLADGWGVRTIGQHLHLSHKTIEAHRANIMKKLEVTTIPDLTKLAIKEGLIFL